ncbi:DsrE family protein [Phaeospirillum tilakii]|uniref:DsrE family protein n=1 Tax=Phaeospirillum tilakii TaxID=741673 RepID=A0ABW5CEQ8_9PROT
MAEKLGLLVESGLYDRVHYGLAIAAAALAVNRPVTLMFSMAAVRALEAADGWTRLAVLPGQPSPAEADAALCARGVAGFEELLAACAALGARLMVCEMGLRALGLTEADLRRDVTLAPGGLVTFLAETEGGALLLV